MSLVLWFHQIWAEPGTYFLGSHFFFFNFGQIFRPILIFFSNGILNKRLRSASQCPFFCFFAPPSLISGPRGAFVCTESALIWFISELTIHKSRNTSFLVSEKMGVSERQARFSTRRSIPKKNYHQRWPTLLALFYEPRAKKVEWTRVE